MTFDPADLKVRLGTLTRDVDVSGWLVGLSGGVDSSVLLHALCALPREKPVGAVHVNHNLHPDAPRWAAHCARFAAELDVPFTALEVAVPSPAVSGPEAAARDARYAALLGRIRDGDCLLVGHHENDQAETLLLNLMRGSGPAGLAGISAIQPFGPGHLLRPLLGVPGSAIVDYATRHGIEWIDDPSNTNTDLDRNYLRHEVLPSLAARWPAAANRIARSAELLRESTELQDELADIDLATCGSPERLSLTSMRGLTEMRQRNLLRRSIRRLGLPPAPATRLHQAIHELIPAREDRVPLVTWSGAEIRRYREHLYVMAPLPGRPDAPAERLVPGGEPLTLGVGQGTLALVSNGRDGIDPSVAESGLTVRYRTGGEEIRTDASGPNRKLKKLMQEADIPPWTRDRLPLLYAGDTLAAVADLWIAAEFSREAGFRVVWNDATERTAAL